MECVEYKGRTIYKDGKIGRKDKTGFMKATDNGVGYLQAAGDYVHRWVWKAFNGEIPNGFVIDHIDADKTNNHLSNLQMLTRDDNLRKAHLTMDTKDIHTVFYLKSLGWRQVDIAKEIGLTQTSISRILSNKQYKK